MSIVAGDGWRVPLRFGAIHRTLTSPAIYDMEQEESFGARAAVEAPILVAIDEEPPALINLLAENYRFNLAARHSTLPSPAPPSPAAPISILLDASHARQTSRVAHFFPHSHDAVPRNASQFDIQSAIAEHNAACYERQQLAIHRAARRYEAHPARRATSSQGSSPRASCERQPQKIAAGRLTGPARGRQHIAHEKLGETLTISKVAIPGRKRRKSSKPILRDAANHCRAEVKWTPRRYRSPPPRISGRNVSSAKCAIDDHSRKTQQRSEGASDA